jgi:hypothetical protein
VGLEGREIGKHPVLHMGRQGGGPDLKRLNGRCSHWRVAFSPLKLSPTRDIPPITTSTAHSESAADLQQQVASLSSQLEEARDEAELNLLMLQQVQEELEFYFLAHQNQEQLLQGQQQQLQRAEALIQALLERLEQQG